MHLRKLNLCLCAHTLGKRGITDDVAERLPGSCQSNSFLSPKSGVLPFRLVLRENLPLRMIANVADLGEAANIERLRSELRHVGDGVVRLRLQDKQYAKVQIADADAKMGLLRILEPGAHSERAEALGCACPRPDPLRSKL